MRTFASNVLPNSENSHMQEFLYKSQGKVFPKAALKVYYGIFLAIKETGAQDFFIIPVHLVLTAIGHFSKKPQVYLLTNVTWF
jgi:hypothetical protein